MGVPYATAYYALFNRGHALPGETVLVHGASGGVGTAAVQIARSRGLVVIGTASTSKGRELVAKEGAHHVLDHSAPDYFDQLMTLTDNRGVQLILEMLANVNLGRDLKVLTPRGRVVVIRQDPLAGLPVAVAYLARARVNATPVTDDRALALLVR